MAQINIEDRLDLLSLLPYEERGIVCKKILESEQNRATVYSIFKGEGLSCDPSPYQVLLIGLEGKAEITIKNKKMMLGALESIFIPSRQNYKLTAIENFKMISITNI